QALQEALPRRSVAVWQGLRRQTETGGGSLPGSPLQRCVRCYPGCQRQGRRRRQAGPNRPGPPAPASPKVAERGLGRIDKTTRAEVGDRRADSQAVAALAGRSGPGQRARGQETGRTAARGTRSLDETVERRAQTQAPRGEETTHQITQAAGAALSPSKPRTGPASPRRSVCAPEGVLLSSKRRPIPERRQPW